MGYTHLHRYNLSGSTITATNMYIRGHKRASNLKNEQNKIFLKTLFMTVRNNATAG